MSFPQRVAVAMEAFVPSGLPLRDVLLLPPLDGASVLGGSAGLDRTVRSVNVMEVPDILDWVRADELLLTTAYPLRDRPETLARLIPELHAHGLAGIAVKPARYIERVPDAVLRDADRLGFPVLALPPSASFNQILNGVLTVLLNRQAARLERAAEIHQRFNDLVLTGGGLGSIATALAQALARPVALVDASGVLRAATAGFTPDASAVASFLATGCAGTGDPGPLHLELAGQPLLIQPVRAGDELHGAVVTVQSDEGLTDDAREALQYAATVSALRQVQARAVAEEERRFKTLCLEELVSEHVADRRAVVERGAAFGWDLAVPRVALVAASTAGPSGVEDPSGGVPGPLAAALRATAGPAVVHWERSSEVAALVPASAGVDEARHLAERLRDEVRRRSPQHDVTIGIGRAAATPDALPRSFHEARRALHVGRCSRGAGCHAFEDLGVERLLSGCDADELDAYVRAAIGPLIDYDAEHDSALVPTLEQFLALGNAAEAARRLFIHVNTLRHRLARIEALVGPLTSHPERCLELALALRIRRSGPRGASAG